MISMNGGDTMLLNVIVKYQKVRSFDSDESISLFKSFESDFVPRIGEHIQDSGFGEDLLIKKVEWVFENSLCNIQTLLVGSTREIQEIQDGALAAGWKLINI